MQTTDTSIETLVIETKRYAQTDMLCYRSPEDGLAAEQRRLWDPVVSWAREQYGVRLELTEGVMPVAQPEETLAALEAAVDDLGQDETVVRNFAKLTKLLGSLVLALAVKARAVSTDEAIEAAFLEEVFQAQKWGEDEEATEKRAAKMAETREVIVSY